MARKYLPTGFTLVEIVITVAIIALLCLLSVPNVMRSRQRSQAVTVKEEARLLSQAKDLWVIEQGKAETAIPTWTDLSYYINSSTALYLNSQAANAFMDSMGSAFLVTGTNVQISPLTKAMFDLTVTGTDPSTFWMPY